jgi:hypothetical protein
MRAGLPGKFRAEMITLVIYRDTQRLTSALGSIGRNLSVYVLGIESPLASVAVPEFNGLLPSDPTQTRFYGTPDELLRAYFFIRRRLLDFVEKRAGKLYGFVAAH